MGLTAIKAIANFSHGPVVATVNEPASWFFGPSNVETLTVHGTDAAPCNMLIPWCTSQAEFAQHHILLDWQPYGQSKVKFYVWQSSDADGDFVRYSTDGQYHGHNDGLTGQPAPHVGGDAAPDGDRMLKIIQPPAGGTPELELIPWP